MSYRKQVHAFIDTLTDAQLRQLMRVGLGPVIDQMLKRAQEEEALIAVLPPPMNPQIAIDMFPKRRVRDFFNIGDEDLYDEDPRDEFWDMEFWRDD